MKMSKILNSLSTFYKILNNAKKHVVVGKDYLKCSQPPLRKVKHLAVNPQNNKVFVVYEVNGAKDLMFVEPIANWKTKYYEDRCSSLLPVYEYLKDNEK